MTATNPGAPRLAGKVVVVTGGGSGIGRAIVERCAADGAQVTIADLDAQRCVAVRDALSRDGASSLAVTTDVRSAQSVDSMIAATVAQFGRIDAVVANAGFALPATPFVDLTLDDWNRLLATDLTGVFLTLQAAARQLVAQGQGGTLIATGSSTVLRPGTQRAAYVAAKGGVHALVRMLSVELAPHRIRVNALVPGLTDTPSTRGKPGYIEAGVAAVPLGEAVPASELGALAAFMISDDAAHMTGSITVLDGGRTCA
ncbi:MAG: family oxidoreductase [Ilumatobacteraceae bacterium]|nr:family oxidoreductase [Ilumatobacteraceae bacterium]